MRKGLKDTRGREISVSRQCRYLGISRSTVYYKKRRMRKKDCEMMREMDRFYMEHPTSGARTMRSRLNDKGYNVGTKHVQRLMRQMGLEAIHPVKSPNKPGKAVYKAPYLLRNEPVGSFNHVWSMDISYIAMREGFMYMIGIIDVYSRMLVGWRLTNTLDARESVETLEEAVRRYGVPDIVNTDQGRQYTGKLWHDSLQRHGIRQSMDGCGRCKDNIWIERFWRTLKRECVYLNPVGSVGEMRRCIAKYIDYYNNKRHHQGIGNRIPAELCPKEILNNKNNNKRSVV